MNVASRRRRRPTLNEPTRSFAKRPRIPAPQEPRGTSGTKRWGGRILEEHVASLQGVAAIDTWDKMRRTDAMVRTLWQVTTLPIRAAKWEVELGGVDPEKAPKAEVAVAEAIRDFIREALFERADRTFADMMRESLLFLPWGFVALERALTIGQDDRGVWRTWLRDLCLRHPRSILQSREPWVFDGDRVDGFNQTDYYAPGATRQVFIRRDQVLLLSNEQEGANVEGMSALRPLNRPYVAKTELLDILLIGLEKQAVGIPIGKLSDQFTPERQDSLLAAIAAIRAGEEAGIVLGPAEELEIVPGQLKADDLLEAIRYQDSQMALAWLAQFVLLGQGENGGAYALSADQTDLFMLSLKALAEFVAAGWTKDVIRPLVELNFGPEALRYTPQLRASIHQESKTQIADLWVKLTSGVNPLATVSEEDEDALRRELGLPPRTGPRPPRQSPSENGAPPGGDQPPATTEKPEDPKKPKRPQRVKNAEGEECDHGAGCTACAVTLDEAEAREAPAYPELEQARDDFQADVESALQELREDLARELGEPAQQFAEKAPKGVTAAFARFVARLAGDVSSAAAFSISEGLLQANIALGYATGVVQAAKNQVTNVTVRRESPEVRALLRDAYKLMSDGSRLRFEGDLDRMKELMAQGLRDGKSPREILDAVEADLKRFDRAVLRRIVNTELAAAATAGSIAELGAAGVKRLQVKVGPYACATCRTHAGNVISIRDARPRENLPPYHPHCFCGIGLVTEPSPQE